VTFNQRIDKLDPLMTFNQRTDKLDPLMTFNQRTDKLDPLHLLSALSIASEPDGCLGWLEAWLKWHIVI